MTRRVTTPCSSSSRNRSASSFGEISGSACCSSLYRWVRWKYGAVLLLIAAFWSVLHLSGTLAAEARRGSLDIVAATPLTRRRIAAEKVGAHVALLTTVTIVMSSAAWLAGAAFAKLPGDQIPLGPRSGSRCGSS
jgi:hypothetical protein